MSERAVVVIGAGDATGGAVARRFAREDYIACPVRRSEEALAPLIADIEAAGGRAHPFGCDARVESEVVALFETIEREVAPIEVCVFNIGANARFPFLELEEKKFRKIWEMAAYAGYLTCRQAALRMAARGQGTILVTGASASVKGYANGAAFASAKFALRGMTQAMARELGPLGVHVAHVVIDGAIDTAFIRDMFPERYALKADDGILNPDSIAETYWMLHNQPRDAWTLEMDIRPWREEF
ncbi:SDR family oxidoreductase [Pikeienuella piscinae]|uniref:SDR family oxidoreductase n=1 Tax=Pikeienuella piscinae TaxID=2748098 RepID=A0A7L5C0L0_9RHOB|nr:SDR family oxidoreductase [Pikeienuella piscinae]QIE55379.1 SDR family oxidoreductase [Pikeienuella piscinae]